MPGFVKGLLVGVAAGMVIALLAGSWWLLGRPDPLDRVIATSRGGSMADPSGGLYQVVVSAEPEPDAEAGTEAGVDRYLVSAIICISTCTYRQDLGAIGYAESPSDAVARFGEIRWEPEVVTIGGHDGVQRTIERAELEAHR